MRICLILRTIIILSAKLLAFICMYTTDNSFPTLMGYEKLKKTLFSIFHFELATDGYYTHRPYYAGLMGTFNYWLASVVRAMGITYNMQLKQVLTM